MGDSENFCVRFRRTRTGPHHLHPIMDDRDLPLQLNGQWFDCVRLQPDAPRRIPRDPIGYVILAQRRRAGRRPADKVFVPKRTVFIDVVCLDIFPVCFLKAPDLFFLPDGVLRRHGCHDNKQACEASDHLRECYPKRAIQARACLASLEGRAAVSESRPRVNNQRSALRRVESF